MKKAIFSILAMLCLTQAVAQDYNDYEYVPFVREGVKWVYLYDEKFNPFSDISLHLTLELKGDTVINDKTYKFMHKYCGESINAENDTIPVCLREENKVVYAFVPNGVLFQDCPVGNYHKSSDFDAIREGREFILYDFSNPIAYCRAFSDSLGINLEHLATDIITIGKHHVKRYGLYLDELGGVRIIEGIGMETWNSYPLSFFLPMMYGWRYYKLLEVIEDGEIIYDINSIRDKDYSDWYKHKYVPFVREGVKWVYYYDNPLGGTIVDMPEGKQYYSFELGSDVLIGEKYYKPVILTHYLDKDGKEKVVEDYIPAYLREEDSVVYAIQPDGIQHPQCPVGIGQYIGDKFGGTSLYGTEEFVLYDFNDPVGLYDRLSAQANSFNAPLHYFEYMETDYINFINYNSKRHHYDYSGNDRIIEGIGYDGDAGMPLFYLEMLTTGQQVGYALSHVIENGEIIYKGIHYSPEIHVGIDEAVADKECRVEDGNYYNLMGQPVGKEVPTTPGIYIHNGKKICVSRMP